VLTENGWTVPDTGTRDRFGQMIVEAMIDRLRVEIEVKNGNFAAEAASKIVRSGLAQIESSAEPGERIMDLFERYAKQRIAEKGKRLDTVDQDRKIIQRFACFIGEATAVNTIKLADVRDWRDTVAALPPMFASAKAYHGLSLREAAAKARAAGTRGMSPTTVNKYLSTLSPFLVWCVGNGYAERNPCDRLFYRLQKGRNPRPPFTSEQLKQILASPLFTGFRCDGKEHLRGYMKSKDWRFWIPLVCLFTGARISEVSQLRLDDVQSEDGMPFIWIRHDEKRGQKTKSARSRIAPIHSKLAALGFLRFVEELKSANSGASGRLFPELLPNSRDNSGATASRFWRDYLRRISVKSGADGYGSHSFRHLLADRLRLAGFLNEEIKVALGHSQASVTRNYGQLGEGTVKRLSAMLEGANFDEVDDLLINRETEEM
jgi:integrase